MKNRPNPRGMTRDDEGSQIEKIGDGRYLTAWPDAAPIREEDGDSVKDWAAVHMCWHSSLFANANVIYARVRPWRYFSSFPQDQAAGVREGAWISDFEVEVALSAGAITTQRSSSYVWETRGAEKMTWEIVEIVNLEGVALTWTMEQLYGYIREDMDAHVVAVTSPNAGDGGTTPPQPEPGEGGALPLAKEDTLYSNVWGDFVVAWTDANTLTLHDVPFPIREEQIYAVGRKVVGAITATTMYFRDDGTLVVDYNPATGALDIDNINMGATDILLVYIEGPHKTIDVESQSRRVLATNPDAKHVTLDGTFVRVLAEQDPIAYVPLNMAEDGLHYLSLHHNISGDAIVTIEGTNDLDREGLERWDDITQYATGFTSIVDATPDVIPPQCWIGYRRIRLVLSPGEAGGTVTIHVIRSAYGDLWKPNPYDGFPLAPAGPQIMGEPRSVQAAALTQGQAGRLVTNLHKELVLSNFIWPTQANRTEEDDPIDTRDVGEEFAVSNIDANTVYDYYVDMAHYTDLTLQLTVWTAGGGTIAVVVEFSDQDDGTAPNACVYADTTLRRYGAATILGAVGLAESIGDAAAGTPNPAVPNINMKWAHIEVTVAGDPTDAAFELWTRRLWR